MSSTVLLPRRLRDGDKVRIDVASLRIDVDADLSQRTPARMAPRVRTGVLAKFARDVSSASRGAVTSPGPLDAHDDDTHRIASTLLDAATHTAIPA